MKNEEEIESTMRFTRSSLQLNEKDGVKKQYLKEHCVSVIDTWRTGASVLIKRIQDSEKGIVGRDDSEEVEDEE